MKKPTIFMIHGMWVGAWYWDKMIKVFNKAGYKCIAPTLRYEERNRGEAVVGTYSMKDYSSDLQKELDKIKGPVIVFGHSMGGLLAQMVVNGKNKKKIKSVILFNSASPWGFATFKLSTLKMFMGCLIKPLWWKRVTEPPFDSKVRWVYDSGRALFEISMWFLDMNKTTKVRKIKQPTLMIGSDNDKIAQIKFLKKLAKFHDAELKVFKGTGHMSIGNPGWEKVAAYALDWVNSELR